MSDDGEMGAKLAFHLRGESRMLKTVPSAIVIAGAVIALAIVLGALIHRQRYTALGGPDFFGRIDVRTGRIEICQPNEQTGTTMNGNRIFALICTDERGERLTPR
jgi:hypothetical protein